jgi:hypothetical protein
LRELLCQGASSVSQCQRPGWTLGEGTECLRKYVPRPTSGRGS